MARRGDPEPASDDTTSDPLAATEASDMDLTSSELAPSTVTRPRMMGQAADPASNAPTSIPPAGTQQNALAGTMMPGVALTSSGLALSASTHLGNQNQAANPSSSSQVSIPPVGAQLIDLRGTMAPATNPPWPGFTSLSGMPARAPLPSAYTPFLDPVPEPSDGQQQNPLGAPSRVLRSQTTRGNAQHSPQQQGKRRVVEDPSSNSPSSPTQGPPKRRPAHTSPVRQGPGVPNLPAGFGQHANPPASAVTPAAALQQRNRFEFDRTVLKYLDDQNLNAGQGTNAQIAYEQAFIMRYYATIGRTAWKYLTNELRDELCNMFGDNFVVKENPAKHEVVDSVTKSKLIEERGVANPNLNPTDADMDASDHINNQGVIRQAIYVAQELNKYLVDLWVLTAGDDPAGDHVLAAVRNLLESRIGFYAKIEIVAKAMVIWPGENFTSTSVALTRFITENDAYLKSFAAAEEEEEEE